MKRDLSEVANPAGPTQFITAIWARLIFCTSDPRSLDKQNQHYWQWVMVDEKLVSMKILHWANREPQELCRGTHKYKEKDRKGTLALLKGFKVSGTNFAAVVSESLKVIDQCVFEAALMIKSISLDHDNLRIGWTIKPFNKVICSIKGISRMNYNELTAKRSATFCHRYLLDERRHLLSMIRQAVLSGWNIVPFCT